MPNHTTVHLDIDGPQAAVLNFVATVHGSIPRPNEDGRLDFNKIAPLPEELRGTRSPANITAAYVIENERARYLAMTPEQRAFEGRNGGIGPHRFGITVETSDELIAKYGCNNWYDWQINMWGTKWNAYDVGNWRIDAIQEDPNFPFRARINFQTAWTPPTKFFMNASKQYPDVTFYLFYSDEGGNFVGSQNIADGAIDSESSPDWFSKDGIQIRELLGTVNTYPDGYEIKGRLEYLAKHPEDAMDNQELADLQMLQAQLENKEGEDE